jgi:hypothetical protein
MESRGEWKESSRTVARSGRGRAGAGTWRRAVEAPRAAPARAGEYFPKMLQEADKQAVLQPGPVRHGRAMQHRRRPCLPATGRLLHASAMFVVTESDAAAIRAAFHEEGELSAIIELRQRFPGIDHAKARDCARTIAGWRPLPAAPCPVVPLRPGKGR